MFLAALGIFLLILFLLYVPVYSSNMIEGKFVVAVETEELDSPVKVYYFENYCKSCLEKKIRLGGMVWNCYATIPKKVFMIGTPPKMRESVKLTAYFNVLGDMIICRWTKSNFQVNPEKSKETYKHIAENFFKNKHSFHS